MFSLENQTILSLPSSVSVHSTPVHSSGLLNSVFLLFKNREKIKKKIACKKRREKLSENFQNFRFSLKSEFHTNLF